ncbi:MAG TPA: hypothetical protein VMF06_10100 [Candidatus Limnocylindria bacterium]|nr:hypothetical protein [Candidatus Limnocylindria bacterium]
MLPNLPGLRSGDVLTRPKRWSPFTHTGVVVAPNVVLHNTPESGEHLSSYADFAQGQRVRVIRRRVAPGFFSRIIAIVRRPKSYSPVTRNCEHTALEAVQGKSTSPQLFRSLVSISLGFLFIGFLRRR